jgi:hypothetical protein
MRRVCILLTLAAGALAAPADFNGNWKLLGASGANAPTDFFLTVQQSGGMLQFNAHWEEPPNGQYALTLMGVVTELLRISTAGAEDLNQVGPFVFRSRSHWEKDRLITDWNTSAYMNQWFKGKWTRYLSPGGKRMTLEIAGNSSAGKRSHATLIFERQ